MAVIHFRDHMPMREVVPLRTGGAADYYYEAKTVSDLMTAMEEARKLELSFRIIGQGSRILMSDAGFPGLVIQNRAAQHVFFHDRSQIIVDAGMTLNQLVNLTASNGYSGLEFLAGCHGTVGGAVYHNQAVGPYQMSDHVRAATILRREGQRITPERVDREWFTFGPHVSRFLERNNEGLEETAIASVVFQLARMNHTSILHRVRHYQQFHRYEPTTEPALQVFSVLGPHVITNETQAMVASSRPQLAGQYLAQWKLNAISAYAKNPNYIVNGGLGTSHDAAEVIDRMIASYPELAHDVQIEYFGIWHEKHADE